MSVREGYGQRRVAVSAEAIEGWLVNGRAVNTNLPDDARFLRMIPRDKEGYFLVFESAEWEELNEGEPIPRFTVSLDQGDVRVIVNK